MNIFFKSLILIFISCIQLNAQDYYDRQKLEKEFNEAKKTKNFSTFYYMCTEYAVANTDYLSDIDGQQQQNEIRFKSSSSVTRLDRSADGSTKQQTASLEQNARFKSNSSTSIFKHEEKLKQKQTVKNDQQKVRFGIFYHNFDRFLF